ncbi:MAG TPA: TonB-dependent receptor [Rhizomicrobium sp.]|nr:TonB-dependent receptor [Rhizomicrobium sp.]
MRISRHKAAFFMTASLLALVTAAANAGEINIPASDMRRALDTYIRQSGVQLVYASNDINGLKSNPVHGQYAPAVALDVMLQGTQLAVNWDGGGAAIVSKQVDQAPADATGGASVPETVVVTGSRVISDIANSPTPVTAVAAAQLVQTSPQNITEALNKLPVFMGSSGNQTRPGGTNNGAANNLNLRNFGTNRNLVLFDSHRVAQTQATGAVNVDVLPEMLVQRVDVVTGGASAVYGSDAVTGVINYILDKNYTGIKYQANMGANEEQQAPQEQLGVAAGMDLFGGRSHIEGTVRYQHIDAVPIHNLPYTKDGNAFAYAGSGKATAPYTMIQNVRRNDDPFGGLILCGSGGVGYANAVTGNTTYTVNGGKITASVAPTKSSGAACSVDGQTFVQNGIIGPYDEGIPVGGTTSEGGTGRRDLFTDFNAMQTTIESFGRASYNLNADTTASVQVRATQALYWGLGPNNGLPPGTSGAPKPITFAVNNPYLSAAQQQQLATGNPTCLQSGGVGLVPAAGAFGNDATHSCTFSFDNYMSVLDGVTEQGYPGASGQMNSILKNGLPTFNYRAIDRNMAITLDVQGELVSRWDWDLYYSHDESREKEDAPVNQSFQDTYAAEDAVLVNGKPVCYVSTTQYASLYPNCDPLNPFGPTSLTATQYASFTHQTQYAMTNTMDDLGGSIAGNIFDLPAGSIKAALSGEARWLGYVVVSNANPTFSDCTGLRICSTLTPLWYQTTLASIPAKSEMVYEFAGEVNVPLLKDLPLVQTLSLDVAGRYTNYSISGAVETWKVGFDYHVVDDLKFRGTMSVDIRAPTLNDLFQPNSIGNSSLNDSLTGKSADLPTFTAGNPKLVPEVAHTYTVGTVLTPTFIPNFTASVDYYRINLYQAITTIQYTNPAIQSACLASVSTATLSPYCALATRPFPLVAGQTPNSTTANFPSFLQNESLNSATQKTEGVDFEMDYNFDLDDAIGIPGAVSLRNLFSNQPYISNVAFQAVGAVAAAQPVWTAMPKSRDTLFVGWSLGNWGVNIQDRWLSGYDQNTAPGQVFLTKQDQHIPNYNQVDVTVDKKFTLDDSVADFYLSIQDITDAHYPIAPSLTQASNPGGYPVPVWGYSLGRFFTIGVRGNL